MPKSNSLRPKVRAALKASRAAMHMRGQRQNRRSLTAVQARAMHAATAEIGINPVYSEGAERGLSRWRQWRAELREWVQEHVPGVRA